MNPVLVVEAGLAAAVAGAPGPDLVAVPRPGRRRRGASAALDPEDVVTALDLAGPDAVVLARPAADDPGAAALPALAAVMGREVVRLPGGADAAAWVVAVAGAMPADTGGAPRRLQVLAGVAAAATRMPALRPGVLARWAGCVWRPCPRCAGGGLPGAPCGRCGAGLAAAGAR